MSLTNQTTNMPPVVGTADFVVGAKSTHSGDSNSRDGSFHDRRSPQAYSARSRASGSGERRQFGSSHAGLSENGRELATAIDRYKLEHHRRYITCDEMLSVLHSLGYERVTDLK